MSYIKDMCTSYDVCMYIVTCRMWNCVGVYVYVDVGVQYSVYLWQQVLLTAGH